ncbi:MFS transporter [Micromonospora musae]|uniref:MFS transporter n=1 Tax=Micromonospora musae TaxID=1894970 RepID=UPI003F4CE22B
MSSPSANSLRPPSSPRRRAAWATAILLLGQLMIVMDSTIVNVALPDIARELHFGPAALSWVLNGYILAFGGLLLMGGRLGDVLGRRRMFWAGLFVFTLFSLLSGLATSDTQLVIARVLQGVGGAIAAPQVLALLTANAATDGARNRAIALFSGVSAAAGTLGFVIGGVLTEAASWRWTLLVNVPLGVIALALIRFLITETPRRPGRFDVGGAISATGGAVALVWALTQAPEKGWGSAQTIGGLLAGVFLLAVFVVLENRVSHPLLRLGLLRSRVRVTSLLAIFAFVGSQIAQYFILVQFLEIQLAYSPLQAGLTFVALSASVVALSPFVPRLQARFGGPPLMIVGAVGTVASFLWLATLGPESTFLGALLAPMVINGITTALVVLPATAGVLAGVEPEHSGSASGLFQTMQQLGGAMGLAVIASVYAVNSVPGQFLPGVREAFVAAAVLAAVAGISALLAVSRRKPTSSEPLAEIPATETA